jgi:hypothetical protein
MHTVNTPLANGAKHSRAEANQSLTRDKVEYATVSYYEENFVDGPKLKTVTLKIGKWEELVKLICEREDGALNNPRPPANPFAPRAEAGEGEYLHNPTGPKKI